MNSLWAATPILTALVLMACRISAPYAAIAALSCGLAVTVLMFPTPIDQVVAAEFAMVDVMVEVTLILFGGLLLNRLLTTAGSQARLGDALISRVRRPERALLLIVLGVVPFAESVTGFGVGAIVGIPLLLQIGLPPLRAAVCGLLGLVIVPWGSLAPGTLVAARLAGIDFQRLGLASAELSGIVFVVMGAAALGFGLGRSALQRSWLDLLIMAGALWFGVWSVNYIIGTPLAGVLGSLFAIAILLLWAGRRVDVPKDKECTLVSDMAPYGVLVSGLLATRALGALDLIGSIERIASSPATWLLITCAMSPLLLRLGYPRASQLIIPVLHQWKSVALTTVVFLMLGVLLVTSGMSDALATGASWLGPAYPLMASWLGALGGFLTGSNIGASAMFVSIQAQIASAIGYPVMSMVALQNVGASLAIMAAIPKVMMAAQVAHTTAVESKNSHVEKRRPSESAILGRILLADAVALTGLSLIAILLG
ncbi:L-lactate permease [Halomonas sp. GXIMD04776]|uniref:L-lactate permease n=1 Tax=Halomonas sp. GXIMD04776 TaxID=3415605 RepID=UPI003C82B2CB